MAVYKVPQDVEADDKFLGPLSFKQFLFAGGALISGYLTFLVVTSGAAFLAIVFLPFFFGFGALAAPWSKDQPTEIFLASRIRFMLMKRKRIWDQSGMKDLVTITVPKKEVHVYTDGLSQDQVKSRLSALSSVVDTRGWAVKNMDRAPASDRLVATTAVEPSSALQQAQQAQEEDILDDTSAAASHVDTAIKKSEDEHRKHTLDLVAEARQKSKTMHKSVLDEDGAAQQITQPSAHENQKQKSDPVFDSVSLPQVDEHHASMKAEMPAGQKPAKPVVKRPTITKDEEEALLNKLHKKHDIEEAIESHSHLKTILPAGQQPVMPSTSKTDPSISSTTPVDPAILSLAQNNDRSVESLARETHKNDDSSDGEVVISLH